MKNKTLNLPAKTWQRLQQAKEFFVDLEVQAHEHHRLFLNKLMEYERQSYLKYEPHERKFTHSK